MVPILPNALLRPLARVVIPAVAANATRARIKRYSTRPWPDSSLRRRTSELISCLVIRGFLGLRGSGTVRPRCCERGRTETVSSPKLLNVEAQYGADLAEGTVE